MLAHLLFDYGVVNTMDHDCEQQVQVSNRSECRIPLTTADIIDISQV